MHILKSEYIKKTSNNKIKCPAISQMTVNGMTNNQGMKIDEKMYVPFINIACKYFVKKKDHFFDKIKQTF